MSVHLSVHTRGAGVPKPGPTGGWGGYPLPMGYPTSGTPHQTWLGGYPCQWGTPYRVPPIRPCQGVPHLGHPHQTWPGVSLLGGIPHLWYSLSDLAGGTPAGVVPHLRYPPSPADLAGGCRCQGGTPPWVPPIRPGPTSAHRWT